MFPKNSEDTKTKIMEAAFELFGRYGADGASIRMISEKSGVNVAAVNYHFKNKENLFWEVMGFVYQNVEREISNFSNQSKDTLELSMKTFGYFQKETFAVRNTMKMMLSENLGIPESEEIQQMMCNPMGPPGGMYFAEKIQKEIPYSLSREGLLFGVKAVFGSIFHWSVMICTNHLDVKQSLDPLMTPEQIEKDVSHMVLSTLEYMKTNPKKFQEV